LSIVTISAPTPARGLPPRVYSEPFLAIPVNVNLTNEVKEAFDDLGIPQRCKDWFGDDDFDVRSILGKLFCFCTTFKISWLLLIKAKPPTTLFILNSSISFNMFSLSSQVRVTHS
jgi:hypothetical protein